MKFLLLLLAHALTLAYGVSESIYVGGWRNWTYSFEPLALPSDCSMEHAHGISIDDSNNIIVTYKDANDSSKCLLQWNAGDYKNTPTYLGPGKELCQGVAHGLTTTSLQDTDNQHALYHANNEQALHKTNMNGSIIWSTLGPPVRDTNDTYSPTWIAAAPDSPYFYLADGYGSNHIYVYYKSNGTFTGNIFGGVGTEHGKFQTCHSIYWDERVGKMAVCDRENWRLEYFTIHKSDPSVFEYSHTHSFAPFLQRLCNIRVSTGGMGIIASLEGMVGIVNAKNDLVSVLNITDKLGHLGFLHPHDAHVLSNNSGDFVLVTWNPGRIGYFRRIAGNHIDGQQAEGSIV
jgi:hypothetical protein